jgi:hypothetical protein
VASDSRLTLHHYWYYCSSVLLLSALRLVGSALWQVRPRQVVDGFVQLIEHLRGRPIYSSLKTVSNLVRDDQRKISITAWRHLFTLAQSHIGDEDRYYRLLRLADAMEREGLISGPEWLELAQQAGTLFSSTAECMRVK